MNVLLYSMHVLWQYHSGVFPYGSMVYFKVIVVMPAALPLCWGPLLLLVVFCASIYVRINYFKNGTGIVKGISLTL